MNELTIENLPSSMAERKSTGVSRKSARSQRTIATATTDMSTASRKGNFASDFSSNNEIYFK